jgi:hypothetical protein
MNRGLLNAGRSSESESVYLKMKMRYGNQRGQQQPFRRVAEGNRREWKEVDFIGRFNSLLSCVNAARKCEGRVRNCSTRP